MHMRRRTIRLLIAFLVLLLTALLLAGCPNFTQDTDPVLGEFDRLRPDVDEERYSKQWNLDFIAMEQAWGVLHSEEVSGMLGDGLPREVVVAVLDTEIDVKHPDLQGLLLDSFDATEYEGNDADSAVAGANPESAASHGTHVAGIVATAADNNQGIAGVGWLPGDVRVRIMPVTVLDAEDGKGESEYILHGLLYAAGLLPDNKPERTADVINLSLGSPGAMPDIAEAISDIVDEGITVVAAAGNADVGQDGCDAFRLFFPAAYPTTIAVGSANEPDSQRARYSYCGDQLDIAAPGGSGELDGDEFAEYGAVFSLASTEHPSDDHMRMAGTSMSAPHVAGVAALLYAVSEDMTPSSVRQILTETASPVTHAGSLPNREYGWGILNAERAVRRALMKPYGPYRDDGSATVHESWPFSPQGTMETEKAGSSAPPAEGTYATDRAALVLEPDWFDATSTESRRKRLDEIADLHNLESIPDRGHRYPTAHLREGDEVSSGLLEALGGEPEIRVADYSMFFYRQ